MSDEPHLGARRSLDDRVARLETEFADLRSDMRLIKQEQQHARELMDSHFRTIESSIATSLAETKLIGQRFENAMTAGMQAAGDPTSTPAGRIIVDRIAALEKSKEEDHTELERRFVSLESRTGGTERRVYMALGALALAILLVQLIVPIVLNRLP